MSAAAADVFLSYSRTDAPAVRQIQAYLKQAGLATFLDRDQLPAGQPWLSALEQAIARCAAVAVLVGPAGLGTWQQREIQLALDRQAEAERTGHPFPVIPILLPKVEDPPGGFLRLQTWVDLRSDLADPAQLHLLLTGLRGQPPADVSTLREALCPYRGLLPFREEDAGLFFGREEAIGTLLDKLSNHNLVTLVGRSGSGKSSVVFAGLIPALRRRSDGRTWSVLSLRPGSEPLHALVRRFDPSPVDLPPFEADQRIEQQVTILRTDDNTIGRRIRSLLATPEEIGTDRLLLHIDQWEELYTQALRNPVLELERAERDVTQFIDLLLEATRTSACTVVLTVRADFYGELLKHGPLAAAVQPGQVNLGPLRRDGLTAAIRKPAEAVGLTVDPPLLEALVDEVCNDVGKLPLLEYALRETWRRREGQRLTLNAYGEAGGIDGAVAQRANQIFASLSQAQQAAARRLFVSLVTPGEGREDTRASAVYPEQDEDIAAVIDKFSAADARLLVTGEDAPTSRRLVELSHEAMIREWDLLKNWIESNREALRRREHIRARLRQWEEQGRDSTLLLPPGLPLEEGRKLLADHGDVLIDEVQPYISASITANRAREEATRAAMMPIRAARALVFGIGLGAIFSVLALTPIGAAVEEAVSLPWLFRMRGAIEPPSDVIIVAIDQQSADYLGLPPQPREWPRSHHARLIGELKKRGAAAVIFDLKFERPQSPAEDDEFASAMRDFGRVFLVKGRDREVNPIIGNIGSPIVDVPLQNKLEEAALGVAPFPLPRVESRQVNQVWAFHADDATLPAIALHAGVEDLWLELLHVSGLSIEASALDAKKVSVSSNLMHDLRLKFKNNSAFAQNLRRHFDQDFQVARNNGLIGTSSLEALIRLYEGADHFYLNFYGPPGTVPTISYYHVFSGDAAADSIDFRGKNVFVGRSELTKPVQEDTYPTVFGRDDGVDLSGVEIAATAFANMLKDQALRPAGPGLSASIVFALGVVITLCSLTMRSGFALVIAVTMAAGYAVGAQMVFNRGALWLPVATPLLLQIPTAVVLGFASQNAFVRQQRWRLQRALGLPGKVATRRRADHVS